MTEPFESVTLRAVLRPLVACIRLFALYVLAHGHLGPGGGFQGGVLLGASAVLVMLVRGDAPQRREGSAAAIACAGVLLFALVGAAALPAGRPMLDYLALPIGAPGPGRRALGILLIETGVAIGVAGVIVSLYRSLMAR